MLLEKAQAEMEQAMQMQDEGQAGGTRPLLSLGYPTWAEKNRQGHLEGAWETIEMDIIEVAMAHHGLILGEDGATASRMPLDT